MSACIGSDRNDVAVLERKLGSVKDIWLNKARDYLLVPDLARVDEDEEEGREEELGPRRRSAIERLESFRRHLEAKL